MIASLSSGEAVEILEEGDEWTRIRILGSEGEEKEGWVLTRYLITREPWEPKAERLSKENASLREKLEQLEEQLSEVSQRVLALSRELQEKKENLQQAQSDFAALEAGASDYLSLKEEHQSTQSTLQTAQATIQTLQTENEDLRVSQKIKWFMAGAAALFVGWLMGLIMGKQQKKLRRISSYQL